MTYIINNNLWEWWNSLYEWFFPSPQPRKLKFNLDTFTGYSIYRNLDLRKWILEKNIHLPFHLWIPLACNYNINIEKSQVDEILPEMIRTSYSFKTHMEIENLLPEYECLIVLSQKQKQFLKLHENDLQDYNSS